jgi:hypothetical protein
MLFASLAALPVLVAFLSAPIHVDCRPAALRRDRIAGAVFSFLLSHPSLTWLG